MQTRILSELTRDDLTAQAQNAIQSAIKFYQKKPFWFNEEIATASTADGTQYYALPSDFVVERSMTISDSTTTYPLPRRSHIQLDEWYISGSTGWPSDYSLYEEQIRLYPIPNDTYTMTISYVKSLDELANPEDTNAWMVEGEELIRSRAEYDICMRILRKADWAEFYKVMENESFRNIESATTQRVFSSGSSNRKREF